MSTEKHAPDAVIGTLGTSGGSGTAPAFNVSAVAQVAAAGGAGGRSKKYAQANKNRTDRMDGYGKVGIPVIGPFKLHGVDLHERHHLHFGAEVHRVDQ